MALEANELKPVKKKSNSVGSSEEYSSFNAVITRQFQPAYEPNDPT